MSEALTFAYDVVAFDMDDCDAVDDGYCGDYETMKMAVVLVGYRIVRDLYLTNLSAKCADCDDHHVVDCIGYNVGNVREKVVVAVVGVVKLMVRRLEVMMFQLFPFACDLPWIYSSPFLNKFF